MSKLLRTYFMDRPKCTAATQAEGKEQEGERGNECARDARNGNESAHGREQPCPANI